MVRKMQWISKWSINKYTKRALHPHKWMLGAPELFLVVSVDLHTPNIQSALPLLDLLALQVSECVEKHQTYGVMRVLAVNLLPQ